jgi:beta-glucanase (GH16 family)
MSKRGPTRGRRLKVIVGCPLLSLLLTSCGFIGQAATNEGGTTSASAPSMTGQAWSPWKLVWQDNFNGSGRPTKWNFDTGGYGFGDGQLEWNGYDNAMLNGHGQLAITATKGGSGHPCWYGACEYTSAKIQTTFAQTYGRFEARIELPFGQGLWPAFWMVPADITESPRKAIGEIDVLEVTSRSPYLVRGYAHDGHVYNYRALKVANTISNQYHIYGVDWTPKGITWTFDGQSYGHINAYPGWPFDRPFIMLLDLAVGGWWPGPPNSSTVFPASMLVDWVRVYKWLG